MSANGSNPIGQVVTFLIGVAWTGAVLWFCRTRVHFQEGLFDFVIIWASGAFGWLPFALQFSPEKARRGALEGIVAALIVFLVAGPVVSIVSAIFDRITPQGTASALPGFVLSTSEWIMFA